MILLKIMSRTRFLFFFFQRIDLNMIITTPCHLGLSGSTNDTFDKYVLPTIIISSRYIHLPSCVVKSMSLYQKLYFYFYFYLKKKKKHLLLLLRRTESTRFFFSFLFWFLGETKHKILIQSIGISTPSPTPFDPDLSLSMTMSQYR